MRDAVGLRCEGGWGLGMAIVEGLKAIHDNSHYVLMLFNYPMSSNML